MSNAAGPGRWVIRVVAFLWGLQFAFLSPALALLLVSLFGASTGQVAVVLVIYNGACLLASWVIPRWADRRGDYVRPMTGCAVFTIALCVALLLARDLTAAVVGLVLLGAPAAVAMPLLFGHVRHAGATPAEVVQTRAVFSMSWVAGPPIASIVIAGLGAHALVLGIGLIGAVNLVAISRLPAARRTRWQTLSDEEAPERAAHRLVAPLVVAVLVASFAALQAANAASVSMTTLFVTKTLDLPPLWGGIALAVAAGLEVPALFLLGRRTGRVGDVTLLTVACLAGVLFYLGVSVTQHGYQLIALEVLNAAFYGVVAGIGLTLFQSIIAGPGAAAGLLSNAQRAGSMFAGPLVGVGYVLGGGLRVSYVACSAVVLVVGVGLQFARRLVPRSVVG